MLAQHGVSEAQSGELLTWLEQHPQEAKLTHLDCNQLKASSHSLWEELASRLNAFGCGSAKTGMEWRQYWDEVVRQLRKKGPLLLQHSHRAGCGTAPYFSDILTPIEERALNLIGLRSVIGNESVRHEVDMGLDEPEVNPESSEPASSQAVHTPQTRKCSSSFVHGILRSDKATTIPMSHGVMKTNADWIGHLYEKRKHTAKNEEFSPAEKSRRQGPPRWALDLEERRLALESERLDESRRFHTLMLKQQLKFHGELLSVMRELVSRIGPPLHDDVNEETYDQ